MECSLNHPSTAYDYDIALLNLNLNPDREHDFNFQFYTAFARDDVPQALNLHHFIHNGAGGPPPDSFINWNFPPLQLPTFGLQKIIKKLFKIDACLDDRC